MKADWAEGGETVDSVHGWKYHQAARIGLAVEAETRVWSRTRGAS